MARILACFALLLCFGCDSKKKDQAREPGPAPSPSPGPAPGGSEFGCVIAIQEPGKEGAPTINAEAHGQPSEEAAHLAAEKAACEKAGAPADCVRSGKFVKVSGSVKQEK